MLIELTCIRSSRVLSPATTARPHLSLLALALGTFSLGMAEFVLEGILPDLSRSLGVSIPEAGHAISVYALGVCLGATLLILLRNKRPKHILLLLASLMLGGAIFTTLAPSYELLLVARLVSGLPHGAYFGVGTIVAYRLADEAHRGRYVALMCTGMTVANLLGNPVATLLSHSYSWRVPFALVGLMALLTLVSVWRWVPDLDPQPYRSLRTQVNFLRQRAPWYIIAATMCGAAGILSWYSYISPALVDLGGWSASWLPLLMALSGVGMVVGGLGAGWLSDRFSPGLTTSALQGLAAVTLLTFALTATSGLVAVGLMILCCACLFGIGVPEQTLIIQHSAGGEMLGGCCIQIAFNFGNALGAFLGGIPLSMGMGYETPALVGLPIVGLGAVLMLLFHRRYERVA